MPGSNTQTKAGSVAARGTKAKASKDVVLKIPTAQLLKWADEKDAIKPSSTPSKVSSEKSTPPAAAKDSPAVEVKPEASGASTPAPANGGTPANDATDIKKKGPAPKNGLKRGAGAVEDAAAANKARAKPGPKRRKIDGPVDENARPWTTPAPPAGHKLGPKANQGAINACLRALDRSGQPCRRWQRKPFVVKSFTGIVWELPAWGAPKRPKSDDEGDGEGEKKDGAGKEGGQKAGTSGSENQPLAAAGSSSNVGSDAQGERVPSAAAPSSPPAAATPA